MHNIHTVQARLVVRKRQNKINVPVFMPNILKGAYSTNMQRCMHPRFFFPWVRWAKLIQTIN